MATQRDRAETEYRESRGGWDREREEREEWERRAEMGVCFDRIQSEKGRVEAGARKGTEVILFKHLHKAGGTTFCSVAKHNAKVHVRRFTIGGRGWDNNCVPFNQSACAMLGMDNQLQRRLLKEYKGYFLATEGPVPLTFPVGFNGHLRLAMVTVMREPLDRVLSTFKYYKKLQKIIKGKGNPAICSVYPVVPAESSLLEWLRVYPDNWMVRTLAGNEPFTRKSPATPNDLRRAKRVLDLMSVVMTLENYKESMNLMRWKFGWKVLDVDAHRKGSHASKGESAEHLLTESGELEALQLMREKNQLDKELYRYACDINARSLRQLAIVNQTFDHNV